MTPLGRAFFRLGPFRWRSYGFAVMREGRCAWPSFGHSFLWKSVEFLGLRFYWNWRDLETLSFQFPETPLSDSTRVSSQGVTE